ncbi:MAG: hypothetical protein SGJ27_08300 [Candidatus Melainabacteria bacterium]|nr:hypothetical protein [Candidatus Melainabacteria bacterium]
MDSRLILLTDWIRTSAANANGLLVPVSGGSDSALVFHLLNLVYPEKTVGVFIGQELRARDWFCQTGTVRFLDQLPATTEHSEVERNARFQCLSLSDNRWLVGTRNRTENVFGTFSLASRVATYLPILGVWKTDVMELCKAVGVPDEVTASSRRADPNCGRPAQLAEIPLEGVDVFLKVRTGMLNESALSDLTPAQIQYLDDAYAANRFRTLLPTSGPELS